jgi:hypothetical protein
VTRWCSGRTWKAPSNETKPGSGSISLARFHWLDFTGSISLARFHWLEVVG